MVEIKGSAVRDALAAYRERLPDECQKVLESLDADSRTAILGVQASQWLPLDIFVRYLQAQVDITGEDADQLHLHRAEIVVERQLHGVYRIYARLASPESLITRLSAVHETFFRGVRVERKLVEKGKAVVHYHGFRKEHRILEPVILGFYRKVLQVNGAKDVNARFTTSIDEGRVQAEMIVTWR